MKVAILAGGMEEYNQTGLDASQGEVSLPECSCNSDFAPLSSCDVASTLAASRDEAAYVASALSEAGHEVFTYEADETVLATLKAHRPDICYIASGTRGSYGQLQNMLELLNVAYVGSGSQACRLSFDPELAFYEMNRYTEAADEPLSFDRLIGFYVPEHVVQADSSEQLSAWLELCEERIPGGYPFEVTLPVQQGAPKKMPPIQVYSHQECVDVIKSHAAHGTVFVRQWIEGVRLNVVVLGTGWDAHVLPPVEQVEGSLVVPLRSELLSYDEENAQSIRMEIERCAFDVCLALGLQDLVELEIIWDGSRVCVSDINTSPCVMPGSTVEVACMAAGLSVESVLDHLVQL